MSFHTVISAWPRANRSETMFALRFPAPHVVSTNVDIKQTLNFHAVL